MSLFGKEYLSIRKLAGIKNEIPEEYKNYANNRNNISNIINEWLILFYLRNIIFGIGICCLLND